VTTAVKVGRSDQVPEGGTLHADAGGRAVAIVRQGGVLHAMDGVCPHRGGPLGQGTVMDGALVCPWHGWRFEVGSGRCLNFPGRDQACIPVREEGGDIVVEV
jgi:nitrite reductase/ring-hydroxylating ferredoxin subunit